jgi:hypothetical protein
VNIMESTPLYAVQKIPGRGLGLKAAADVKAGATILSDLPIILVSEGSSEFCSACLRTLPAEGGKRASQITADLILVTCRMPHVRLSSLFRAMQYATPEISLAHTGLVPCTQCRQATFCSAECDASARSDPGSHSVAVCR